MIITNGNFDLIIPSECKLESCKPCFVWSQKRQMFVDSTRETSIHCFGLLLSLRRFRFSHRVQRTLVYVNNNVTELQKTLSVEAFSSVLLLEACRTIKGMNYKIASDLPLLKSVHLQYFDRTRSL